MSDSLPEVYLARHGETEWTISRKHTGRTDIPLTERGERNARSLGERLAGMSFAKALVSPLQRATRTCELAGLGQQAEVEPDLMEWDYGEYEGLTTAEIRRQRPGWDLFRDGCPGGESVEAVAARADRLIARPAPDRGRDDPVWPQPLLPRPGGALAGPAARRRPVPPARHGLAQHPGRRAFTGRAGHPPLE